MTDYIKVFPRDFFNIANLLNGLGRVTLWLLETPEEGFSMDDSLEGDLEVSYTNDYGGITLAYPSLAYKGESIVLFYPVNSRQKHNLCWQNPDSEDVRVLNDDGSVSQEFIAQIKELYEQTTSV